MHFGRLDPDTVAAVDLSLPVLPVRTERFLALASQPPLQLRIGCPVWAVRAWVGSLYPDHTKAGEYLQEYARAFATVEVNSTFYQLLSPQRTAAWSRQVTPGFRFCPKVYRGITEGLDKAELPGLIRQFAGSMAGFGDTLGLVFAQLPESIGPQQSAWLKHLLELWPGGLPLAIEFRHPGWFRAGALLDEAVNLLYRHRVATVVTDTPGRRDACHLSLTQPLLLIRFQGNLLDETDAVRLRRWTDLLRGWSGQNLAEAYLFAHQPGDELIPATARLAQALWDGTPTSRRHLGLGSYEQPTLF